MGQVKRKGSFEERKKAAIDKRAQDIAEQKQMRASFDAITPQVPVTKERKRRVVVGGRRRPSAITMLAVGLGLAAESAEKTKGGK